MGVKKKYRPLNLYKGYTSFMLRFDEHGAHLYHMDPSGTYLKFDAKAIGSGSEGAQQSLQVRIVTKAIFLNLQK
jgi:20S proteasome alpha/beta subunit